MTEATMQSAAPKKSRLTEAALREPSINLKLLKRLEKQNEIPE